MIGKSIHFFNVFSAITLIMAFISLGFIFYWTLYPYNPASFKEVIVQSKTVQAGSTIKYTVDYCKNMNLSAEVTRAFVNGVIFTTNQITTDNPRGCRIITSLIQIPQEMTSGSYRLRTTWVYQVNPIRRITLTKDSNLFEIVGSDLDRQADQR